MKQKQRKKKPFKTEHNYREAFKIMKANQEIFNEQDTKTFVINWVGKKALETLDKNSVKLKCGVGHKPGANCTGDECLLLEMCVHKDVKPIPISEKEADTYIHKTDVPEDSKRKEFKLHL